MGDTIPSEVIATYTGSDGVAFEIDHLCIGNPGQRGEFAVYRDGYLPAHRPELPDTGILIVLANRAAADEERDNRP